MEEKKEKSMDSLKKMDTKAFWLGVAALVGILGLPYLVTQCSFGYSLGVKDANAIGDSLGGILGPFIGLISAFLVYLALREQIKANILIHDQFLIEDNNEFENQIFTYTISSIQKELDSIENFKSANRITRNSNNFYEEFNNTLLKKKRNAIGPIIGNLNSPISLLSNISNLLQLFNNNINLEIKNKIKNNRAYYIIVYEKLNALIDFVYNKAYELDLRNGNYLNDIKNDHERLYDIECILKFIFEIQIITVKLNKSNSYFSKEFFRQITIQLDEIFESQESISLHMIDIERLN